MPRKPEPLEQWMLDAIRLMVRQNLSLRQAAQQLGHAVTPQQANNIAGRIRFQDAFEEARLMYYAEIGSGPKLTKDAVVGQIFKLAERLASEREDYKAADTLLKLAKIRGWIGEAEERPAFANLTQRDIDELRAKVREAELEQQEQTGEPDEQTPAELN
jgi:hypothetical protein